MNEGKNIKEINFIIVYLIYLNERHEKVIHKIDLIC